MEILIPSQSRDSSSAGGSGSAAIRAIYQQPHEFLGRQWSAFYIRDAGHRKPVKDVKLEKDTETRYQERLYMFAEDGIGFERGKRRRSSQRIARGMAHVPVTVASMLDWLLHLRSDKNRKTPFTKLFSRIQLGKSPLADTRPTGEYRAGRWSNDS